MCDPYVNLDLRAMVPGQKKVVLDAVMSFEGDEKYHSSKDKRPQREQLPINPSHTKYN